MVLADLFTRLRAHDQAPCPRLVVGVGISAVSMIDRLAERHGYLAVAATTPLELLWLLTDSRVTIALVVSDVWLPTASGRELLQVALEACPGLCSLLVGESRPPLSPAGRPVRARRRAHTRRPRAG